MSPSSSFDASIPVLTEILHAASNAEAATRCETAPVIAAQQPDKLYAAIKPVDLMPSDILQKSGDHDWTMLEQQLSERILSQLQQHITLVLEPRMAAALQGLSQEISDGLHASVTQIVAKELAGLLSSPPSA